MNIMMYMLCGGVITIVMSLTCLFMVVLGMEVINFIREIKNG